jgi:cytosine/adenosine deaminase-related metal-dependent hydrolase
MEASDEAAYLRTLTGNLKANYQQYFPNEKHQPASLDQLFNPTTKLLLIHNLYISKNEEEYIQQQFPESYRVLCPASNLYISNQCPSYQIFKEDRICLGTDSLASNQKLSMLQEMLEMQNAHPELCFETLLSWACINGANALDVSKEMGSFEPGKKPGIVLLENFDFQTFRITKKTTSKRLV